MVEQKVSILLVDDDEDDVVLIREYLVEGMSDSLYIIDHASSCAEAESHLMQVYYDICLFDYRLGEVDGLDLLRSIRNQKNTIPVIFLTGQGDEEVAVEAMKAGATNYLVKAKLTPDLLCKTILDALEKHEINKRQEAEQVFMKSIAERYAELLQQKELFFEALSVTPQALILGDERGEVYFANPAAQALLQQRDENENEQWQLSRLIRKGMSNIAAAGEKKIVENNLMLHVHALPGAKGVVALLSESSGEKRDFTNLEGVLTRREIDVLTLLRQEMNNKEIAVRMLVSTNTVKRHLDNMYAKLAVSSRTELLAKIYRLNGESEGKG